MITKNDFQTMLKSPEHLSTLPLEELENLVRHYPWFSLGQTLLAKAYKDQNTYKFSDQLSLASTLSSNRNWLYTYLKAEPVSTDIEVVAEVKEVEVITVEIPQQIEEPPVPAVSNQTQSIESLHSLAERIVAEEERETERETETERERERETETETETETEREEIKPATEGMDLLDKSILATAVSSSIYLEVGEEEVEEPAVEAPHETELISPTQTDEALSSDPFIQWLQGGDGVKSVEEIQPNKASEELQQAQSLIDRFIANEPKITPGKAEQYTGVSFAQNSLDDSFEWVTETMAKLYAVQGKIDRARKAYKRLIELHPEKKIYFEQQLKALNQRK